LVLIIISIQSLFAIAEEGLRYEILKHNVSTAWLSDPCSGYYKVIIELNEKAKIDFEKLTKENIGKKLEIIYSGKIVTQAVIKTSIDSGIIQVGKWEHKEDANKFIDALLQN
jgi:preprotein translocase subunit SecD